MQSGIATAAHSTATNQQPFMANCGVSYVAWVCGVSIRTVHTFETAPQSATGVHRYCTMAQNLFAKFKCCTSCKLCRATNLQKEAQHPGKNTQTTQPRGFCGVGSKTLKKKRGGFVGGFILLGVGCAAMGLCQTATTLWVQPRVP